MEIAQVSELIIGTWNMVSRTDNARLNYSFTEDGDVIYETDHISHNKSGTYSIDNINECTLCIKWLNPSKETETAEICAIAENYILLKDTIGFGVLVRIE